MGYTRLADQKLTISSELQQTASLFTKLASDQPLIEEVLRISKSCIEALQNGNRIIFAGNGGSAADAQHFAAELVGRFYFERPGLPSIALSTDTSMLTAIGNDYGFKYVFERQLQANAKNGDVFIAMSTSGDSENILQAIQYCQESKIISIGLAGETGGKMKELCDHCICVPSMSTPRIQEMHTVIGHLICAEIERQLFDD